MNDFPNASLPYGHQGVRPSCAILCSASETASKTMWFLQSFSLQGLTFFYLGDRVLPQLLLTVSQHSEVIAARGYYRGLRYQKSLLFECMNGFSQLYPWDLLSGPSFPLFATDLLRRIFADTFFVMGPEFTGVVQYAAADNHSLY